MCVWTIWLEIFSPHTLASLNHLPPNNFEISFSSPQARKTVNFLLQQDANVINIFIDMIIAKVLTTFGVDVWGCRGWESENFKSFWRKSHRADEVLTNKTVDLKNIFHCEAPSSNFNLCLSIIRFSWGNLFACRSLSFPHHSTFPRRN